MSVLHRTRQRPGAGPSWFLPTAKTGSPSPSANRGYRQKSSELKNSPDDGEGVTAARSTHTHTHFRPNPAGGVTSEIGGPVRVGQPDPPVCALAPQLARVLFRRQGPLDQHEERRGGVVRQRPVERHAGAVDERHAKGAHAAACPPQRTPRWLAGSAEERLPGDLTFGRLPQRHPDVVAGAAQAVVGFHGYGLRRLVPLKAVGRRHRDAFTDD